MSSEPELSQPIPSIATPTDSAEEAGFQSSTQVSTSRSRIFVRELDSQIGAEVLLRGWVFRLRSLAKNTFILLRDCSGTVQCVADPALLKGVDLGVEDTVEIAGVVRRDERAKGGVEVQVVAVRVLNQARRDLPFHANSDLSGIGSNVLLDYRALALRSEFYRAVFKVQAAILREFRAFLSERYFIEIVTSKIVASGTEGGANLFEIKYFERVAYLAQSPQFFKEQCTAAFERVFETAHVYRAEPHLSSRHLTEYCSLDLELGFIDGPEEIIQLERELLTAIFKGLNESCEEELKLCAGNGGGDWQLPSMLNVPTWEFEECLDRLRQRHGRTDLHDDLDPEAERQLCALAEEETGVPAVFVLGFPLNARPFYTHARGSNGAAQSFDLLFRGLEITTGGQRIHSRSSLEAALQDRGVDPGPFDSHLRMFELGMPPHGGLAIGLERLTAQVLGLSNVRDATLYPRDRNRVAP